MRRLQVFVAVLLLAFAAGCSSGTRPQSRMLQSVMVTPAQPSIALGVRQQFTATGHFSDGTSLNLSRQVDLDFIRCKNLR